MKRVTYPGKGRSVAMPGGTFQHLLASVVVGAVSLAADAAAAQDLLSAAQLVAGDAASLDQLGWSVAVSGDTAVLGATGDDDRGSFSGSAYVFVRSGATWAQQAKLLADDGVELDQFGYSVAVSGDTVLVAAGLLNGRGVVYVFGRSGTLWTQQGKLLAGDGAAQRNFGFSIALAGGTAVIGAYGDSERALRAGAAYVFVRDGANWSQQAKLLAADGVAEDRFGISVALAGDTAVIGADNSGERGAAYVFARNGTGWSQQAKLLAADGALHDGFGGDVSVFGGTAVVTAPADDDRGDHSGSAYVFARTGTSWTQQAKLLADDGAVDDLFGWSAVLDGDTAVITSRYDDDLGNAAGAAYVFVRKGGRWTQRAKLFADNGAPDDEFGDSVAMSGSTIVVGAPYHDHSGADGGSAYVFPWRRQVPLAIITTLLEDED